MRIAGVGLEVRWGRFRPFRNIAPFMESLHESAVFSLMQYDRNWMNSNGSKPGKANWFDTAEAVARGTDCAILINSAGKQGEVCHGKLR